MDEPWNEPAVDSSWSPDPSDHCIDLCTALVTSALAGDEAGLMVAQQQLIEYIAATPTDPEHNDAAAFVLDAILEELFEEHDPTDEFGSILVAIADLAAELRSGGMAALVVDLGYALVEQVPELCKVASLTALRGAPFDHWSHDEDQELVFHLHMVRGVAHAEAGDTHGTLAALRTAHRWAPPADLAAVELMLAEGELGLLHEIEAADWALRSAASEQAYGGSLDDDDHLAIAVYQLRAIHNHAAREPAARTRERLDFVLAHSDWLGPDPATSILFAAKARFEAGRRDWDAARAALALAARAAEQDDEFRAEIKVLEVAILFGEGDFAEASRAIRAAAPVVALGTPEQRYELASMLDALGRSFGRGRQPLNPAVDIELGPTADEAAWWGISAADLERLRSTEKLAAALQDRMQVLASEVNAGVPTIESAAHFARLAADARRLNSGQQLVAALVMHTIATIPIDVDAAQVLLHQAKDAFQRAAESPEGILAVTPMRVMIDLIELLFDTRDEPATRASLRGLLDRELDAGRTFLASGVANAYAAAVATGPDKVLAVRAALISLELHRQVRLGLPSSVERAAFDLQTGQDPARAAYRAVERLNDQRVIAELIEYRLAQSMPVAPATATPERQSLEQAARLLEDNDIPDVSANWGPCDPASTNRAPTPQHPQDDDILIARPARVRMPWGEIALQSYLDSSEVATVVDLQVTS